MNRTLLGALAALLLVAGGVFWWQGRAETESGPPLPVAVPADEGLPAGDGSGLVGAEPPAASEATREQRRFDRIDRNRDGRITRVEMLTPRAVQFRKLDKDGNNLLSFEEWAVRTSDRFRSADANRDTTLDRAEFATTRPKRAARSRCDCAPQPRRTASRSAPPAAAAPASDPDVDPDGDEADPLI